MISIFILAHQGLANAYARAVETLLGKCDQLQAFDLDESDAPETLTLRVQHALGLNEPFSLLALTDLYGGTPWRIATSLAAEPANAGKVIVLSGVNLAMVLEACMRRNDAVGLFELAASVAKQGRENIQTWPER